MTIRVRDLMPMFTATDRNDGTRVDYHDVWQKKNLVLVTLPDEDLTANAYARSLSVFEPAIASRDARLIVTTTRIEAIPSPGIVIADRWGEVYFVKDARCATDLPGSDEVLEWVEYVQNECPECQGETR